MRNDHYNRLSYCFGIINKISHSLAQNLIIDYAFPALDYFKACIETLNQAGVPENFGKALVIIGTDLAYKELIHYKEGKMVGHYGGSSIHPQVLLWQDAVALAYLLKGGENLEELIQYVQEVAVTQA
jgi:hypothetical protein